MKSKRGKASADRYKRLLDKVKSVEIGSGGFWRPPEGRSTVRILPPVGDMEYFFKEIGAHRIAGKKYYCPAMCTEGEKPCPICEVNEALYQAGEKETAADFRAQRKFWMNVAVRGAGGASTGPFTFTPGVTIFSTLIHLISDPDYGDITDDEDGFDIKIDREGSGLNTKYQVHAARNPSPAGGDEEELDGWLDDARDIDEFIAGSLMDYDELAKASGVDVYLDADYDGIPDEDDEDDEDEDKPASASKAIEARLARRRSSRRRGRR